MRQGLLGNSDGESRKDVSPGAAQPGEGTATDGDGRDGNAGAEAQSNDQVIELEQNVDGQFVLATDTARDSALHAAEPEEDPEVEPEADADAGADDKQTEKAAQSIHEAARKAAAKADSIENKKKPDGKPNMAIGAAAAAVRDMKNVDDDKDFDDWLDELDAKLAAASALLDKAAAEKEALHAVEKELAAAQKQAAERVAKERRAHQREARELPAPNIVPDKHPGTDAQVRTTSIQSGKAELVARTTSDTAKKLPTPTKSNDATSPDEKNSLPAAPQTSTSIAKTENAKTDSQTVSSTPTIKQPTKSAHEKVSSTPAQAPPAAPMSATASASKASAAQGAAPAIATAVPQSSTGAPAYDPEIADECVKFKRLAFDERFWKMSKLIMDYARETAKEKWIPDRKIPETERRRDLAVQFRNALVELGPTFIKLGQFLSVRRDLLSPELADELATLQDNVPPFPAELAIKTIAAELGQEPDKLFLEFDNTPLASASIGQVHRARLHDGREVVVKVQRADLSEKFYQDLGYMRSLIRWGRRIKKEGDWDGWLALSDEFGRSLFSEIDYLQEGKNADRMRINLRDSARIRIPRVVWKYTGRHVLAFEYVPGIKIDKISELKERNFDLVEIGNQLVFAYLEQVLIHGYFHADPHAGNLAVDDEGRIIIYDFGMVGEISEAQRLAIAGCVTSVIDKNGEDVAQYLVELGVLKADVSKAPVVRTLTPFIDYYSGKSMRDLDFTKMERDIDQIALERALKLPANLAYLLRAGSSVEGIARTLQPDFSFVEAAKPFIQRWLLSKPTAFGALLKIFLAYSKEAYRSGTEKLTSGSGIFGFGKRKSKTYSQEGERAHQLKSDNLPTRAGSPSLASPKSDKTQLHSTSSSANISPPKSTNKSNSDHDEWLQTGADSANQALERDRQNQQRQIYLLETRLRKSARLQMVLGWSVVGALVLLSLFLIAIFFHIISLTLTIF